MNKLSAFKAFTLKDGRVIEVAFKNGTFEIYGRTMGFSTFADANKSLVAEKDAEGNAIITFDLERAYRHFVSAAVQFAAEFQGKSLPFENEWQVADFIEEVGIENILAVIDQAEPATEVTGGSKKKGTLKAKSE